MEFLGDGNRPVRLGFDLAREFAKRMGIRTVNFVPARVLLGCSISDEGGHQRRRSGLPAD